VEDLLATRCTRRPRRRPQTHRRGLRPPPPTPPNWRAVAPTTRPVLSHAWGDLTSPRRAWPPGDARPGSSRGPAPPSSGLSSAALRLACRTRPGRRPVTWTPTPVRAAPGPWQHAPRCDPGLPACQRQVAVSRYAPRGSCWGVAFATSTPAW